MKYRNLDTKAQKILELQRLLDSLSDEIEQARRIVSDLSETVCMPKQAPTAPSQIAPLSSLPHLIACSQQNAEILGVTRAQLYRLAHIDGIGTSIGGRRYLLRDPLFQYLGISSPSV